MKNNVVILDRWNTSEDNIKRLDMVVLTSSNNQNITFIERVIRLEGDVVETPRYRYTKR